MRKWVPQGELLTDRSAWAVILDAEEFEALGEILGERTAQKKPDKPEPIEVGQVWLYGAVPQEVYHATPEWISTRPLCGGSGYGATPEMFLKDMKPTPFYRREEEVQP